MDPALETLRLEIAAAASGIQPEILQQRPADKWSAAEVLEHLYLTYTGTAKGMSRVIEAGKPLATASTLKHRARRLVVLTFSYLPGGREAPPATRPKGLPTEKVLAEIGIKIEEMDAVVRQCEEKFGIGTKLLDHPVLGALTGAQWRKFHCVHGRHHLQQIERRGR